MPVESMNLQTRVNMLQFKAAEHEKSNIESKAKNVKKNSNELLYGTLAGLAAIGIAGALYITTKGKKPTFRKFKELGLKVEDGFIIDKNGQPFTGEIFGRYKGGEKIIRYQDGKKYYVVLRPKNSEYKEIKKIYDYENFEVCTKKIKTNGSEETSVRNINAKKLDMMIDEILEIMSKD